MVKDENAVLWRKHQECAGQTFGEIRHVTDPNNHLSRNTAILD